MLPGFSSRGHMFLKKKLFEEFQHGCLISERNCSSHSESPFCLAPPVKFLLKRTYGLEEGAV